MRNEGPGRKERGWERAFLVRNGCARVWKRALQRGRRSGGRYVLNKIFNINSRSAKFAAVCVGLFGSLWSSFASLTSMVQGGFDRQYMMYVLCFALFTAVVRRAVSLRGLLRPLLLSFFHRFTLPPLPSTLACGCERR